MHTEAHLFSLPNYCLWYDKLWGPSQRVATLFHSIGILIHVSRTFTKAVFQDQSLEIIDADLEVEAELYTNEEGRGSLDQVNIYL